MLRILIAEDDPLTRQVLAEELSQHDRVVATAADGEEALATALTFAPHLVITDVDMPHMTGWDLVARLRTHRETALTPVIFVTASGDHRHRMRGLRLGAVDYLVKPVDLEELALRVRNALSHCLRAEEAVQSALLQGIAGSLIELPLGSLLNVLALERRSGVLDVRAGDASARLVLHAGDVVSARSDAPGTPAGADCVYALLRANDGQFVFTEAPVSVRDEIGIATMALLMEGARRLDEEVRAGSHAAHDALA